MSITWSKFDTLIVTKGSHSTDEGYIDAAFRVARNPRNFTPFDCIKAANILRSLGGRTALAQLHYELARSGSRPLDLWR